MASQEKLTEEILPDNLPKNLYEQGIFFSSKAEEYRKSGELEGALINYLMSTTNLYTYSKVKGIPEKTETQDGPCKENAQEILNVNIKWIVPLQEKLKELKKNRNCPDEKDKEILCKDVQRSRVPCIKFHQISGQEKAKEQIKTGILKPLLFPRLYPFISKGILFYGPPGTGKTLLAKSFVNELQDQAECYGLNIKVLLYAPTGASLKGKYVGETEKNITKYFNCANEQAKKCTQTLINSKCVKPCDPTEAQKYKVISVIFLDEIEAIAGDRSKDDSGIMTNSVNTLLQMMDGINDYENVVVMGATNFPWSLDPAILRRFDTKIFVSLPTQKDISNLIKIEIMNYIKTSLKPFEPKKTCGKDVKDNCGNVIPCNDNKSIITDIATTEYGKPNICKGCCDTPVNGEKGKEGICCGDDVCIKNECTKSNISDIDLFYIYRKEYFPSFSDDVISKIGEKYENRGFSGGDVKNACRYVFKIIGLEANKKNKFRNITMLNPNTTNFQIRDYIKDEDKDKDKIFKFYSDFGRTHNYTNLSNTHLFFFLPKSESTETPCTLEEVKTNFNNDICSLEYMAKICREECSYSLFCNWENISGHLGSNVSFLANYFAYLSIKVGEDKTITASATHYNIFSEEFIEATQEKPRSYKQYEDVGNTLYYIAWRFRQFEILWSDNYINQIIPENMWGVQIKTKGTKIYLEYEDIHDVYTKLNSVLNKLSNDYYDKSKIFKIKFFGFDEGSKTNQTNFLKTYDTHWHTHINREGGHLENEHDIESFFKDTIVFYKDLIENYHFSLREKDITIESVSNTFRDKEIKNILKETRESVLQECKSKYFNKFIEELISGKRDTKKTSNKTIKEVYNMFYYTTESISNVISYYDKIGNVFIDFNDLTKEIIKYYKSTSDTDINFESKLLIYVDLYTNMPKILKRYKFDPRIYFTVPMSFKLQPYNTPVEIFKSMFSIVPALYNTLSSGIKTAAGAAAGLVKQISGNIDHVSEQAEQEDEENKNLEQIKKQWEKYVDEYNKDKDNIEETKKKLFRNADKMICIEQTNETIMYEHDVREHFETHQVETEQKLTEMQEDFDDGSKIPFRQVKQILDIEPIKNIVINSFMLKEENINVLRLLVLLKGVEYSKIKNLNKIDLLNILNGIAEYNISIINIGTVQAAINVVGPNKKLNKFKDCITQNILVNIDPKKDIKGCGIGYEIANYIVSQCKTKPDSVICDNYSPDNNMIFPYDEKYKSINNIIDEGKILTGLYKQRMITYSNDIGQYKKKQEYSPGKQKTLIASSVFGVGSGITDAAEEAASFVAAEREAATKEAAEREAATKEAAEREAAATKEAAEREAAATKEAAEREAAATKEAAADTTTHLPKELVKLKSLKSECINYLNEKIPNTSYKTFCIRKLLITIICTIYKEIEILKAIVKDEQNKTHEQTILELEQSMISYYKKYKIFDQIDIIHNEPLPAALLAVPELLAVPASLLAVPEPLPASLLAAPAPLNDSSTDEYKFPQFKKWFDDLKKRFDVLTEEDKDKKEWRDAADVFLRKLKMFRLRVGPFDPQIQTLSDEKKYILYRSVMYTLGIEDVIKIYDEYNYLNDTEMLENINILVEDPDEDPIKDINIFVKSPTPEATPLDNIKNHFCDETKGSGFNKIRTKKTKNRRKIIRITKKNKRFQQGGGGKSRDNLSCQDIDPPASSILSFGINSNFDMISFNFRERYFDDVINPTDPSHIKASTIKEKINELEEYQTNGTIPNREKENV